RSRSGTVLHHASTDVALLAWLPSVTVLATVALGCTALLICISILAIRSAQACLGEPASVGHPAVTDIHIRFVRQPPEVVFEGRPDPGGATATNAGRFPHVTSGLATPRPAGTLPAGGRCRSCGDRVVWCEPVIPVTAARAQPFQHPALH